MKPFEVHSYDLAHQAIPLGEGWWRGPAIEDLPVNLLLERGLICGEQLADGSQQYMPSELLNFEPGKVTEHRDHWIAARIHAGILALELPPASPQAMVILNLTDDSFSDGGRFFGEDLFQVAKTAIAEGATILDLGAESTRPGANAISDECQLDKLLPAISKLQHLPCKLSIDTRSPKVASACLAAGADWINDVSGLADPKMAQVVAKANCKVVIMHMRGTPMDMQERCNYQHLIGEIADELCARVHLGINAGILPSNIILDPGFGFSKTAEQCFEILANLGALRALGFPLLSGPSRKSFLCLAIGDKPPLEREAATSAAVAQSVIQGAEFIRVHHVGQHFDIMKTCQALNC